METHEPSMVSLHMAHAMCVQLGLPYDHADENSKEKAVTTQVKEKKEQYKQVASARTTINNREWITNEEKETIFSHSIVC